LQEIQRRQVAAQNAGSFLGWWWIWLLVFIGIFWFAGWGWGGYGGWWWGPRATVTAQTSQIVSGNGVAVLDATDKQAYIGHQFQIRNAPVQNVVNDREFWIEANGSAPTLVVLTGTGNNIADAKIGNGNRVDVTGTVMKAPPANEAQNNWKLGSDDANRLEKQGAYIEATQVEKIS